MGTVTEFGQISFAPLVVVFTVSNLAAMGLQVRIPQVLGTVRLRFLVLVAGLGWVAGPALGYLIARLFHLDAPYAAVMLLTSLAPCAPFLPPMVVRARGDLVFAGAFIPVAAVGAVLCMPAIAPLVVPGLTLTPLALARPLVATVLIPLLLGAALRTSASPVADAVLRPLGALARLSTALVALLCVVLYGGRMLDTAGSLALVSMTVFMLVLGLASYAAGLGLPANQRSVLALGMATRNIAAVFAGVLAIPDGDPRMLAMVVMWTLWSFILAGMAAPLLAKLGDTHEARPVVHGTA